MVKIFDAPFPEELEEAYREHFSTFEYELSDFQKHSIRTLVENHNSLVTASTGSGKSTPAEFAIKYFVGQGKRVIYTAPIKALSNQKYHDFTLKFQNTEITVGLLTGDVRANDSADIIVMTTEILHNQLRNGEFNAGASAPAKPVGCVIFDEIHYINDLDRGNIWEESIIMLTLLNESPSLLMLSATIAKPHVFADWIEKIGLREVWIATTGERVVPLMHYAFITYDNIDSIKNTAQYQNVVKHADRLQLIKKSEEKKIRTHGIESTKSLLDAYGANPNRQIVIQKICTHLQALDMLPCIIFVFSRKQLIECAEELCENFQSRADIEKECEKIISQLPNYLEYMHLPEYIALVNLLRRGIAIHHGGMLSVLREMVEIMFDRGFVKVLFATETFAAGINLPVKTVVFTQLHKYSSNGKRNLHSFEYTQMAGRAGRRGIDSVGNVIHLVNLYGAHIEDMKSILNGKPQTLKSKLKISYDIVLSATNGEDKKCTNLPIIYNSMLKTEIDQNIVLLSKQIDNLHKKINKFQQNQRDVVTQYQKSMEELKKSPYYLVREERAKANKTLDSVSNARLLNDIIQELKTTEEKKVDMISFIQKKIDTVEAVLLDNGFFDSDRKITKRGIIAQRIKKANPLLFGHLIDCGILCQFSPPELAALLSCFVRGKKTKVSPERVPKILQLKKIAAINDHYASTERKYNINSGVNYELNYKLLQPISKWCDSKNETECRKILEEIDISTGDFIKAILEIVNIAEELYKACEYVGETEMCHKLQQISELLLKYIAYPQSLYV